MRETAPNYRDETLAIAIHKDQAQAAWRAALGFYIAWLVTASVYSGTSRLRIPTVDVIRRRVMRLVTRSSVPVEQPNQQGDGGGGTVDAKEPPKVGKENVVLTTTVATATTETPWATRMRNLTRALRDSVFISLSSVAFFSSGLPSFSASPAGLTWALTTVLGSWCLLQLTDAADMEWLMDVVWMIVSTTVISVGRTVLFKDRPTIVSEVDPRPQ